MSVRLVIKPETRGSYSGVGFCVARSTMVGNARSLDEWDEQQIQTLHAFSILTPVLESQMGC